MSAAQDSPVTQPWEVDLMLEHLSLSLSEAAILNHDYVVVLLIISRRRHLLVPFTKLWDS